MIRWLLGWAVIVNVVLYFSGLRTGRGSAGRGSPKRSGSTPPVPGSGGPQRILVIGANGRTGRQLVLRGLERGLHVTAFVRNPAKLDLRHERLTVAQGDVMDAEAVESAVRGQDAVLSALGHGSYYSLKGVLSRGTANVIHAMEKHGSGRFICETSLGIGDSVGRLGLLYSLFITPLILPIYFYDKCRQEALIAASNLEWVIVRPTILSDGSPRGTVRQGMRADSYLWPPRISRTDVADFMLDQLENDGQLYSAAAIS